MARSPGWLRTAGPAAVDGVMNTPLAALPGYHTGPVGPIGGFQQINPRRCDASWHALDAEGYGGAQGRSARSS
eukprot:360715-Amphidinium_carterae.1